MTATPIAIAVPPSKAPRAAAGTAAGIDPFILPDLPVAATPEAPASAAPADDNAEDGSGADAGHSGIDTAIALATLQTASPLPEAAPPSPAASLHEMQQAAAAAPATSEQALPAAAPTLLPAGSAAGQPAPEARTPAALPAATASESAPEPAGVTDMPRPATATALNSLWLAGDYVCADYPATLEGAVRSGVAAARALLASPRQPGA